MRPAPDANFADRRPGDLFRAMAMLYLREHPKQSRESLARKLQRRLEELGISYHHRTLKRQLDGSVASVPPVVEDVMRELVDKSPTNKGRSVEVEQRLDEAGLAVSKDARRRPNVSVSRLVPPTKLWLYLNPGRSKRHLAHKLSTVLDGKTVRVSADRLQSNLAGKGAYVRREVLKELVSLLAREGFASEAEVLRAYERLGLQIERSLRGRQLTDSERFKRLADTWWLLRRKESKRALAKRLQGRLAEKGIRVSLDHLQDQFHGRKGVVQQRVVDELESLVRDAIGDGRTLEQAMTDTEGNDQDAADLAWVKAEPIAAMAREWLDAHPGVSRRNLALRVTDTVRSMGYETSEHTVQPVLAGLRQKTRGYVYRAMLGQMETTQKRIPATHIEAGRAKRLAHRQVSDAAASSRVRVG